MDTGTKVLLICLGLAIVGGTVAIVVVTSKKSAPVAAPVITTTTTTTDVKTSGGIGSFVGNAAKALLG